jgi:hypothetical protein
MTAFRWYLASLLVLGAGTLAAAMHYPGGFDWVYTVASALASRKHNPDGSTWFAGALGLSMILLWPYVSALKATQSGTGSAWVRFGITALRTGLICGALLGLEKLLIRDLSNLVYKAHEILALVTFAGLYSGVLALILHSALFRKVFILPLLLVSGPLAAIALTQFWLYIGQRDLGWVDTSWREMGIPLWLSFAFWQWLAIGLLWLGLGMLALTAVRHNPGSSGSPH